MSTAPRLRVVGSGPVALAFGLFSLRQGFAPADVELSSQSDAPPAAVAGRVLALSLGSWQLLSRIATLPRAAAIETVEVSLLGHPGRTRITATELRVPALGYVLRYSTLMDALQRSAQGAGLGRSMPSPPPADTLARDPAAVVVHAEGDTGDGASVREFDQAALLAEVSVDARSDGTAFECFTARGPLALLPLPEPGRHSLVWCDAPEESRRRAGLSPEQLSAELQSAFGWPLGRIALHTQPIVWPMVRRARRVLARGNEVWIGNAAQALHPVAGQGLNLGVRDAFLLAQVLGEAASAGRNLELALDRYLARRRLDRGGTIALTDTLARLFGFAPLRPLQSLALAALDATPAARAALARQFMFGVR